MINVISVLTVLCILVETILIFQYAYSLLMSLNSDIFNGLTKALSIRFFGGILLHLYWVVIMVWFLLTTNSGEYVNRYNSTVLFILSFLMILTLLAGVNTYFYYFIKKQVKDANKALRNNESGSDSSIEPVN